MPVTDTIADFLTRIRNAAQARHKTVDAPASKEKTAIAEILKDQGYIANWERVEGNGPQGTIRVTLRYHNGASAINQIVRVSKPGRRIYASADEIPRVKNGLGVAIISTSKGIVTDKQARAFNAGGEVICTIW